MAITGEVVRRIGLVAAADSEAARTERLGALESEAGGVEGFVLYVSAVLLRGVAADACKV